MRNHLLGPAVLGVAGGLAAAIMGDVTFAALGVVGLSVLMTGED